ncbi:unnamed protein product, partial [Staurois parvus]
GLSAFLKKFKWYCKNIKVYTVVFSDISSTRAVLQVTHQVLCLHCRGGLTIWKLGHCPRARGQ